MTSTSFLTNALPSLFVYQMEDRVLYGSFQSPRFSFPLQNVLSLATSPPSNFCLSCLALSVFFRLQTDKCNRDAIRLPIHYRTVFRGTKKRARDCFQALSRYSCLMAELNVNANLQCNIHLNFIIIFVH